MENTFWLNVILSAVWAFLFTYVFHEKRKTEMLKLLINHDMMIMTGRILLLKEVWSDLRRMLTMYEKYSINDDDKRELNLIFAKVAKVLEGADE